MLIDIDSTESLKNATEVLANGGVLIFPTDTVYGVGCKLDKSAIRKLYKIKNRPNSQPTAVLMSRNVFDGKRTSELVLGSKLDTKFYNGKLTIIDESKNYAINFPKMILAEDNTIGIRLPSHEWLSNLIDEVGPIVTSSANKKGDRPPAAFAEVSEQIIKEADLVIRSDEKIIGTPSSIYHLELKKELR